MSLFAKQLQRSWALFFLVTVDCMHAKQDQVNAPLENSSLPNPRDADPEKFRQKDCYSPNVIDPLCESILINISKAKVLDVADRQESLEAYSLESSSFWNQILKFDQKIQEEAFVAGNLDSKNRKEFLFEALLASFSALPTKIHDLEPNSSLESPKKKLALQSEAGKSAFLILSPLRLSGLKTEEFRNQFLMIESISDLSKMQRRRDYVMLDERLTDFSDSLKPSIVNQSDGLTYKETTERQVSVELSDRALSQQNDQADTQSLITNNQDLEFEELDKIALKYSWKRDELELIYQDTLDLARSDDPEATPAENSAFAICMADGFAKHFSFDELKLHRDFAFDKLDQDGTRGVCTAAALASNPEATRSPDSGLWTQRQLDWMVQRCAQEAALLYRTNLNDEKKTCLCLHKQLSHRLRLEELLQLSEESFGDMVHRDPNLSQCLGS